MNRCTYCQINYWYLLVTLSTTVQQLHDNHHVCHMALLKYFGCINDWSGTPSSVKVVVWSMV